MANKTRSEIRTFIEYYLSGSTDKSTEINSFIDVAVEEISYKHNFRSLRGMVEATLAQTEYYVSAPTDWKENIKMLWLLSATGESGIIPYKDEVWYHKRFQYIDWATRGEATPQIHTKIGDYLYFNVKADKSYTIRLWYQKFHKDFTTLASDAGGGATADTTSHLFKPNQMGVMAITAHVLSNVKDILPLTQEGQAMAQKYIYFRDELINADMEHGDERMTIEAYFDSDKDSEFEGGGIESHEPYGWV